MGTSTSFRSPATVRWRAFVAALDSPENAERVRSELFNAGNEWAEALAGPAVAAYATAAHDLYRDFVEQLSQTDVPARAISDAVAAARRESLAAGDPSAAALAERALTRTLLETLGGVTRTADQPVDWSERWTRARGDSPADMVSRFAGEVLRQFAKHVVDREAGRLVEVGRPTSTHPQLVDALAEMAHALGRGSAERALADVGPLRVTWRRAIESAFSEGRALPQGDA